MTAYFKVFLVTSRRVVISYAILISLVAFSFPAILSFASAQFPAPLQADRSFVSANFNGTFYISGLLSALLISLVAHSGDNMSGTWVYFAMSRVPVPLIVAMRYLASAAVVFCLQVATVFVVYWATHRSAECAAPKWPHLSPERMLVPAIFSSMMYCALFMPLTYIFKKPLGPCIVLALVLEIVTTHMPVQMAALTCTNVTRSIIINHVQGGSPFPKWISSYIQNFDLMSVSGAIQYAAAVVAGSLIVSGIFAYRMEVFKEN